MVVWLLLLLLVATLLLLRLLLNLASENVCTGPPIVLPAAPELSVEEPPSLISDHLRLTKQDSCGAIGMSWTKKNRRACFYLQEIWAVT